VLTWSASLVVNLFVNNFHKKEPAMASIDALHAILDKAHEGMTPKQLMSLPPSALAGVTDSDAKKLKEAFGIDTIEKLATCKYFLWAQALHTLAKTDK
jgi:hypothetical protein